MKINERGYWENNTTKGHGADEGLSKGLLEFFEVQSYMWNTPISIVDVGCGTGFYVNYLNNKSYKLICNGYDGNPNTPYLAGSNCGVFDFTQDASPIRVHKWVLSLEVGEHIPKKYEGIFIHNLHILNEFGIVLSWAIP